MSSPNASKKDKKGTTTPPESKLIRRFSFSRSKQDGSAGNGSASASGSNPASNQSDTESNHDDSTASSSGTKKKPGFLATALQTMKKTSNPGLNDGKAIETVLEETTTSAPKLVSGLPNTAQNTGSIDKPGSAHTMFKSTPPPTPKPQLNKDLPEAPPTASISKSPTGTMKVITSFPAPALAITATTPLDTYALKLKEPSDFSDSVKSAEHAVMRLQQVNQVLTGFAAGLKLGAGWLPLVGTGVTTIVSMLNSAVAVEVGKVAALRLVGRGSSAFPSASLNDGLQVEHSATVLIEVQQSIIDHKGDFSPSMEKNLNRLLEYVLVTPTCNAAH